MPTIQGGSKKFDRRKKTVQMFGRTEEEEKTGEKPYKCFTEPYRQIKTVQMIDQSGGKKIA